MSDDTPHYMVPRASNACMYTTYCLFLVIGLGAAWVFRNKKQYLSGNGTRSAIPLAFNFMATGMGAGVLVTFPQIAAFGGIHGLFTYAACGAVPMIMFAALGPIIRKQKPEGFVFTEWIRFRYGVTTSLLVSCCTVLTIFLFMVGELAAVMSAIETITNLSGLPALIVESIFTAIYTSFGGFFVSFFTDNIQAAMFLSLLVVVIIAMATNADIDKALVGPSGLLKANKLSWKLLYILFVAIMTNDCFMAGFWLRTFAAKTDRDLWIACLLAGAVLFLMSAVIGVPGLLAVWSGALDPSSDTFEADSANAFYIVLLRMPRWVHGFVLVFVCALSTCTFDSLQSAMASTISNDFFRNRVRMIYIRAFILAVMAPTIVVALRAPNVLNIYLICDILSAVVIPVLMCGLSKYFYFLSGFEIICSVVGGILTVFIFGTIYFHSASQGAGLLILEQGLYGEDWAAFGTFVAAPVGSVIGGFVGLVLRGIYLAIRKGKLFAVFDRENNLEHFDKRFWEFQSEMPWYEYYNFGPWAKKLDRIIFVPDGKTIENESLLHREFVDSSESESASLHSKKASPIGLSIHSDESPAHA